MRELERIILRLKTAKLSVRSEANKLLLEDCINDLTELDKQLFEEEQAKNIPPTFKIGDKVKLNEDALGQKLSVEGKKQRFLINSFDHLKVSAWCVDAAGESNSRWIRLEYLMLANS